MSWKNDYAKGTVAPAELARMPAGTICIYQSATREECSKLQSRLHTNLARSGAKFKVQMLYAFNMKGEPFYLIHAEVLTQGKPVKWAQPDLSMDGTYQ